MLKKRNRLAAMFMVIALSSGMMAVDVNAGQSKNWDVYYNDSHTNNTTYSNYFTKYTNWYYSAKHTARSSSSVVTLIQPGYGTSFEYPSYVVSNSKIKFLITAASGSYVYVNSVLSYNTAPASTSGIITRPTKNTSDKNDGE